MKDALKNMIQNSRAIDQSAKELYLRLVDSLPDERVRELYKIFEYEMQGCAKIKNANDLKRSSVNKKYIEKMLSVFKEEQKKVIQSEELKDKDKGDEVLKQLDNL